MLESHYLLWHNCHTQIPEIDVQPQLKPINEDLEDQCEGPMLGWVRKDKILEY